VLNLLLVFIADEQRGRAREPGDIH
jgi:hypothetical protein